MRRVSVIVIALLLASTRSAASQPLDVLLLVDYSSPPPGALADTESVIQASGALLAALSAHSEVGGHLRVLSFAQSLAVKAVWEGKISRGLDTESILGDIKNSMSGTGESKLERRVNIGDVRYTDFVTVLTQVAEKKPYSDRHFPVLLIVSNGVDDVKDTQRCVAGLGASVTDPARRKLLYSTVDKLPRRTVLFMTPCFRDDDGYVTYPFAEVWRGVPRRDFRVVSTWRFPPDRSPAPGTAATEVVSSLRPEIYLSAKPPGPIHRAGLAEFQVNSRITYPLPVVACVHPHPDAIGVRDASAHVTLWAHGKSDQCQHLPLVPETPGVWLSMHFRPDGEISRQQSVDRSSLGFRLEFRRGSVASALGPLTDAEFRSLVFPSALNVAFRYEWPWWLCSLLFDTMTPWAFVALGVIPLGLLALVFAQRLLPILPGAWILNCQLFDLAQKGCPRTKLTDLVPVSTSWRGGGRPHVVNLHSLMPPGLGSRNLIYKPSDEVQVWRSSARETVVHLPATSTVEILKSGQRQGSRMTWKRVARGEKPAVSAEDSKVDRLLVKPRSHRDEVVEVELSWGPIHDRTARISRLVFFHPPAKVCASSALGLSIVYFVVALTTAWYWDLSDQTMLLRIKAGITVVVGLLVSLIPLKGRLGALRSAGELLAYPAKWLGAWWARHHHAD